jgi:Family of unknown function (DUF5771)
MAYEESKPYDTIKGCPRGYHKRKAYTVKKTGTRVPTRCIRSTTTYKQSTANYKRSVSAKQTRRLRARGMMNSSGIKCAEGEVVRRAYVRVLSPSVRSKGYTRKSKTGKMVHVQPKKRSALVPATCIKDLGASGKLPKGVTGIGPLRKGELKKHGYVYTREESSRKAALVSAIKEFKPLGVYRKLDAVAKLTAQSRPEASAVFTKDRDWVRATYPLKAF